VDAHGLYVGRLDHRVAALDPASGTVRWTTDIDRDWEFLSRPDGISVSGDTVYALAERWLDRNGYRRAALIVALDRDTGVELWRFVRQGDEGGNTTGAPAVAGRVLVYNDALGGAVTGVDRFTGQEVWRVSGDSSSMGPQGTPVIVADTAFVGSGDRWLYAIHTPSGRVLWKAFTRASIFYTAVCGNLVLLNNQAVAPVDRTTHAVQGYFADDADADGGFPTSGFAVADGMAVVVGTKQVYGIRCT
jgi:outer membrane protein assembly factor BamB